MAADWSSQLGLEFCSKAVQLNVAAVVVGPKTVTTAMAMHSSEPEIAVGETSNLK